MPTVRAKVDAEIDFEMWCGLCGAGICAQTKYKQGTDNHFVASCKNCESEIKDLEQRVRDADDHATRLKEDNEEIVEQIKKLEAENEKLRKQLAHACAENNQALTLATRS